jgi:hypothetical protein
MDLWGLGALSGGDEVVSGTKAYAGNCLARGVRRKLLFCSAYDGTIQDPVRG